MSSHYKIVPNLEKIAREVTSKSQFQLLLENFLKLSLQDKLLLLINNIRFIPRMLQKDFATGIKLLCEIEVLESKKQTYALHYQLVDMSIALKNMDILAYFFYISTIYQFHPRIISNNLTPLINHLSNYSVLPHNLVILTPINKMNPDYQNFKNFIKISPIKIQHFNIHDE